MGSTNREYMRDDYDDANPPAWGYDVPTTKRLIIVTVVMFILQTMFTHGLDFGGGPGPGREIAPAPAPAVAAVLNRQQIQNCSVVIPSALRQFGPQFSYVEDWFVLDVGKVFQGQIWRLVTYVFCHPRSDPADTFNLVFKMVFLWFLGSSLERMYGSREILWFYLTAALVSGLVFCCFGFKLGLPLRLMGSGPCILALFTLFATHFPRQEILFFWVVPVQVRVLLLIYVAIDVFTVMQAFAGQTSWVRVAYLSELWGVAFGYLYREQKWRLSRIADMFDFQKIRQSMRRATTARNLKVFQPEPISNLDEQVDAILAKIHEKGSESLTDRERSVLQRASEQAKHRL